MRRLPATADDDAIAASDAAACSACALSRGRHPRLHGGRAALLDAVDVAETVERSVRHESHPAASDTGQFRLRVHPGRFRPLSPQHVLRFRRGDSRRAHLPLHGRLCAGASAFSRTRRDLSCDVRDLPDLAAGHHRAALHPRAHAPHARQLRGIDHSFDLQRLRHLPSAPILSRDSPRARGGGADRRRRLLPHLAVDHPAA